MAGLKRRKNGLYRLNWYEGGRRLYLDLGTRDRRIAEEKKLLKELELQERGTLRPSRTLLSDLIRDYLEDAELRLQPETIARTTHILDALAAAVGEVRVAELTTGAVEGFLKELLDRGYSPATFNRYRACLSALFRFGIDKGILRSSPLASVRSLPVDEPDFPPFLSPEELDALLAAARDTYLEVPVALGGLAGLRKGEMERLEREDVDLARRVLTVVSSKRRRGKKKGRVVPLARRLEEILRRRMAATKDCPFVMVNAEGGPFRHNLRSRLAALGRKAGIETPVHPHLLRHTFASHKAMAGVSLWKIARWLGHSSVTTTMVYAHLAPQHDPEIDA